MWEKLYVSGTRFGLSEAARQPASACRRVVQNGRIRPDMSQVDVSPGFALFLVVFWGAGERGHIYFAEMRRVHGGAWRAGPWFLAFPFRVVIYGINYSSSGAAAVKKIKRRDVGFERPSANRATRAARKEEVRSLLQREFCAAVLLLLLLLLFVFLLRS